MTQRRGRPDPSRPGPGEVEQREDYLHRINRCEHPPEYQRPGWPCGGCGKERDEIEADMEDER